MKAALKFFALSIIILVNVGLIRCVTRKCGFSMKKSNKDDFMEKNLSATAPQGVIHDIYADVLGKVNKNIMYLRLGSNLVLKHFEKLKENAVGDCVTFPGDSECTILADGVGSIDKALDYIDDNKTKWSHWNKGIAEDCAGILQTCVNNYENEKNDACLDSNQSNYIEYRQNKYNKNYKGGLYESIFLWKKPLSASKKAELLNSKTGMINTTEETQPIRNLGYKIIMEIFLEDGVKEEDKRNRGILMNKNFNRQGGSYYNQLAEEDGGLV